MLNISNLDEGNQSKEGFIKSIILLLILLAFCFAPFLAYSQSKQVSLGNTACKKGMVKFDKSIIKQEPRMAIAD